MMENLRKIRKLNEQKAEKVFALTQLANKKSKSSQASFVGEKDISSDNAIFIIKNLDENKIEVIDQDQKVDRIIGQLSQLPDIQKLLGNIWEKYSTQLEKEEELFLEACYQGNVQMVQKVVSSKSKHPVDPRTAATD